MAEKKQLSPKLDVVFHMLFGEPKNESITKKLLEDVLDEKIIKIELDKNPYLWGNQADDKLGIIDVKAEIDDKNMVDIEIQRSGKKDFVERILLYWAKMYEKQIQKTEKYSELKRCIVISFVDFELDVSKDLPADTKWQIKEAKMGKRILTEKLEIVILELPKAEKSIDNKQITKWLKFLEDPYGEEVEKMSENEKEIKEAVKSLEEINADEAKVRIAELREKYILDRNSELEEAKENGIKQRQRRCCKENERQRNEHRRYN